MHVQQFISGAFLAVVLMLAVWAAQGGVNKGRAYAFCAGLFALIAILAITRHDIVAGIACFFVAIASAVRSNSEWKREHG